MACALSTTLVRSVRENVPSSNFSAVSSHLPVASSTFPSQMSSTKSSHALLLHKSTSKNPLAAYETEFLRQSASRVEKVPNASSSSRTAFAPHARRVRVSDASLARVNGQRLSARFSSTARRISRARDEESRSEAGRGRRRNVSTRRARGTGRGRTTTTTTTRTRGGRRARASRTFLSFFTFRSSRISSPNVEV